MLTVVTLNSIACKPVAFAVSLPCSPSGSEQVKVVVITQVHTALTTSFLVDIVTLSPPEFAGVFRKGLPHPSTSGSQLARCLPYT